MRGVGYNSIPLDLTREILLRLPSKSLFRFRCVSKTWCSLIRSGQFADGYMSLSLSRPPRVLLSFNPRGDNRLMFFSSSKFKSFIEREHVYIYLGYDHINDQYKVLRLKMRTCSTKPLLHSVWTLGGSAHRK
ncbi:hypothetical protein N665_0211s0019 [Sinapis alba]|nr:hypothetical protein N665_0211s0019 [Sinapis alba]